MANQSATLRATNTPRLITFRMWTKYSVVEQVKLAVDNIAMVARLHGIDPTATYIDTLIDLAEQDITRLALDNTNISATYPLLYVLNSYRLPATYARAILEQYYRKRYPLAELPLPTSLY
jgi:hypothetical protein